MGQPSYIYILVFYILFLSVASQQSLIIDESCSVADECRINSTKGNISCFTQNEIKCSNINESYEPAPKANGFLGLRIAEPKGSEYSQVWLAFSWWPLTNVLQSFQAYEVEIYRIRRGLKTLIRRKFYCFTEGQTLKKFFPFKLSDCYGNLPGDEIIETGDYYIVFVNSYPLQKQGLPSNHVMLELEVPLCTHRFFSNHKRTKKCSLTLQIIHYYCENATYHFKYHIPTTGNKTRHAELLISKGPRTVDLIKISSKHSDYFYQISGNTTLTAELMLYPLPRSALLKIQKTECEYKFPFVTVVVPTVIIALLTLSLVAFKFWIYPSYWQKCKQKFKVQFNGVEQVYSIASSTNVYIVFVNDHPRHKEIVLKFASFLQCDLGFNVLLNLWEQAKIYQDALTWMEEALKKSDKIIVIWSPAAKTSWEAGLSTDIDVTDLFLPVVKRINSDLIANKNVGKYCFAYFNYCYEKDVPDALLKLSCCHFNLPEHFRDLHFWLDSFKRGRTIDQNKPVAEFYNDPVVNNHWKSLHDSICDMDNYIQSNPKWFKWKEDQPVTVIRDQESSNSDSGIENHTDFPSVSTETQLGLKQEVAEVSQTNLETEISLDDSVIMPIELSVMTEKGSFSSEQKLTKQEIKAPEKLNPVVIDNLHQLSKFSLPDIESIDTDPKSLLHVSAFSFADSEVVVHDDLCHPVKIEPIDMSSNPWDSLAQINQRNA